MSTTTASGTSPASSATSAAPTTTTSSSASSFFSASGTPAIILAFLAIGLFVGGMVAMFGMRRRMISHHLGRRFVGRMPPGWTIPDDPDPRPSHQRRKRTRTIGKRPDLWDVYALPKGAADSSWSKIVPIAARVITEESQVVEAPSPPPTRFTSLFTRNGLGSFFRSRPPTQSSIHLTTTPHVHLEVAVAITMPTLSANTAEVPNVSLGLAQLPWKSGGLPPGDMARPPPGLEESRERREI